MNRRGVVAAAIMAGWCVAVWAGEGRFRVADMATVKVDKAEVKQGSRVIATLARGQRVKIHWVHEKSGWALVYIKLDGKPVKGYIKLADLAPPGRKEGKALGAGFVPDDLVIVVVPKAKLMKGKEVLGRVPKGTRLTVRKVEGNWVGVHADIDGKKTFGWIRSTDLDYAPISDEEPGKEEEEPKEDEEPDEQKDDAKESEDAEET